MENNILKCIGNMCKTDKIITHGYHRFYNKELEEFRNMRSIGILEIGVDGFNSIDMWKEYFPYATIYGIDINIYYEDEIVAGTTIFVTDNVVHSQYISCNEDKNQLGSLDFLHNYLIKNVFKDKTYFDFGISHEDNGQKINQGLLYWKESFGANSVKQDFYEVVTKNYTLLDSIMI